MNSYEYDIYGKVLSEVESVPNPIRYAHEYYDSESKLYYLRGRYYNPDTKSFTTPDPAEADARLYSYAGYNPIDFIDPSGYIIVEVPGIFIGELFEDDIFMYLSGEDLKDFTKCCQKLLKELNTPSVSTLKGYLIEGAVSGIAAATEIASPVVAGAFLSLCGALSWIDGLKNEMLKKKLPDLIKKLKSSNSCVLNVGGIIPSYEKCSEQDVIEAMNKYKKFVKSTRK